MRRPRREDVRGVIGALSADDGAGVGVDIEVLDAAAPDVIGALARKSPYLVHPVFHAYHSETEMLRYLRRLASKDVALDRAMIPLGSCTMKLNATAEMIPVTFPGFGALHPFVPPDQALGYRELCTGLERMLCAITGFDAVSLQPQRGLAGRVRGAALHPPVPRIERGGPPRRLPDPRLRARHQPPPARSWPACG